MCSKYRRVVFVRSEKVSYGWVRVGEGGGGHLDLDPPRRGAVVLGSSDADAAATAPQRSVRVGGE